MKTNFTPQELDFTKNILEFFQSDRVGEGIAKLEEFKTNLHNAIPQKERISKGITFVLKRISSLIVFVNPEIIKDIAIKIQQNVKTDNMIFGVAIFLMGEYGKSHPTEVYQFFLEAASSGDWVTKEFAQSGFRYVIKPNKDEVYSFLLENSKSDKSDIRRFVGETLRPVVENNWMFKNPDYSLSILKNMFREKKDFPRTSVGNNLSDLSRKLPDLILGVVKDLVGMEDKNSYWIAYRACRNLVKQFPLKVMDILKVDEYHYKDRNFYRKDFL
ncbi:MAG: hypothetical protein A2086_03525 [Spirochaetes bacterium GWD1_27_9]|nr:MAG: hypothetical protein A2Z98_09815 [Spirochaetes bacterium GWB1_27_13]OHD25344.1 MAG: hypothetical protein A2Y34_00035 [Spirochaetes bacterium GWC1_27_15]OHD31126.1 MAG: hypothetical protein A2086_03525 [Spirochaetes bacterium GWD1_27_9]